MEPLPTLRQLRHLVALSEHRHFGRAAAAVGLSQSSLSASLKELERVLDAVLVDRTRRRVVLTPLGESIVGRARRLLDEAGELAREAAAARAPLSSTVRLGVIPTIGPFLLPAVLPALRRAYPKLKLYLTEDLTARVLSALQEGRLDVALIALPWDCGTLELETLFSDRFVLACRADDPLAAGRKPLDAAALAPERLLLLQDGHCLRDHALSACRLDGRRHVEAFEATSLHTLVQMIDNGLGLTLLPQLAIAAGILRGTRLVTRSLRANAPSRDIALLWRRSTARQAEFRLLAAEIKRLAGKRIDRQAQSRP